jgi:hypothetical protein
MKKLFSPNPLLLILLFRILTDKYFPVINDTGLQFILDIYLVSGFGYLVKKRIENKKYWIYILACSLLPLFPLSSFLSGGDLGLITAYVTASIFAAEFLIFLAYFRKRIIHGNHSPRLRSRLKRTENDPSLSFAEIDFWKIFRYAVIGGLIFYVYILGQNLSESKTKIELLEAKLGGTEKISCTEKDSIKKVRESVVRVIGGEAEGSGFAIDNNLILTNFHVIEFEPSPKVVFPDNSFETAEITMADKDADLAILKVNKNLKKIDWGNPSKLDPSEELLAIGFPLGGDLKGEASVNKGFLAGRRFSKDVGVEYIQIDGTLNPGVSGGPMIDVCGKVVGVNTAGMSGLGLAISSDSVMDKWGRMSLSDDPLKDIQKIDIQPNKSSLDAVKAFYDYLKLRKLPKAFELLSKNFRKDYSYDYWVSGYKDLLDTTVIKIEQGDSDNFVKVKLATKNLTEGEIVYKYFEGQWEARKVKYKWQLWEAKIKEIEEPDYSWFYD